MPFGWCCVRPQEVLDSVVAKPSLSAGPPSLEIKPTGTFSSNDSSPPGSLSLRPGYPSYSDPFKNPAASSFPFDEAMNSSNKKDATVSTPALGITALQDLSTDLKVSIPKDAVTEAGVELGDSASDEVPLPILEVSPSGAPTPPTVPRSQRGNAAFVFDRDDLFSPKGRHLNKSTKPSVSPGSTSTASRKVSHPPVSRRSSIHRRLRPRGARPVALGVHDVVTFTHRRRNVKGKILRKGKLGTWVVALYGEGTNATSMALTNETVAKRTKTLTKVAGAAQR